MKFFTQDLIERYASDDEQVALAAFAEFEKQAKQYAGHFERIKGALPPRFVEVQQNYYLHDALVATPLPYPRDGHLKHPVFFLGRSPVPLSHLPGAEADEKRGSLALILQLDPPPKEILVFLYRESRLAALSDRYQTDEDWCPQAEWQRDEVYLAPDDGEFIHAIVLANGVELEIRFKGFDFAVLPSSEKV